MTELQKILKEIKENHCLKGTPLIMVLRRINYVLNREKETKETLKAHKELITSLKYKLGLLSRGETITRCTCNSAFIFTTYRTECTKCEGIGYIISFNPDLYKSYSKGLTIEDVKKLQQCEDSYLSTD